MYEIDTDDSLTPAAAPAANTATPAAPATQTTHVPEVGHKHTQRHPLIKFIGKRDRTPKSVVATKPAALVAESTPEWVYKDGGNGVHFTTLKGMALYGRPPLTAREIDAIESGGAIV